MTGLDKADQALFLSSIIRGLYRVLRRAVGELLRTIAVPLRVARTLGHWLIGRSDYRRWKDIRNLEEWWDSRTKGIVQFIPKNSRVVEFGAGRLQLELYLDSSCSYVPSDLVDRGRGTIICDLNQRPLPDLRHLEADVAVFSGVLEYIRDLSSLTQWLSLQVSSCVASYAYAESEPHTIRRLWERIQRARYGYMNAYTEEELVMLFRESGFVCIKKDTWESQRLFLFAKPQ